MSITQEDIIRFVEERIKHADSFDKIYEDPEAWTSFERIEITLAAEEEFGIMFSQEDLSELRSPKDVVSAIKTALSIS